MKPLRVLVLLGLSVSTLAGDAPEVPVDFNLGQDQISEKYFAGSWLIYDCEEKHWVCVLKEDFDLCESSREAAKKSFSKNLPCAPIGNFPTKRSCFQRELFLAGNAHGDRFCLLDEKKYEDR